MALFDIFLTPCAVSARGYYRRKCGFILERLLSNWAFTGDHWTSDQDGLSVTKSRSGGIYKIGATWENYQFSFDFKIMQKCAGWIIRAGSREHYVMIQCNERQIRPHTLTILRNHEGAPAPRFRVVNEIGHGLTLGEWNEAKTQAIGHSIKVWTNEKLVWSDSELLKDFPMGTVGFRCAADEQALFRNVRVTKSK